MRRNACADDPFHASEKSRVTFGMQSMDHGSYTTSCPLHGRFRVHLLALLDAERESQRKCDS